MDLISRRTRREFRDYLTSWTLAAIADLFRAAHIDPGELPSDLHVQGERRTLVEQYYASIDWGSPRDVRRVLNAYEEILDRADYPEPFNALLARMESDGYIYDPATQRLESKAPATLSALRDVTDPADRHLLEEHLQRIQWSVDADPAQAVGSAKELLETTAKLVLRAYGVEADASESVQQLVKHAVKLLNPGLEEAARTSDSIRQVTAGLAQVVAGTAELRNRHGTGHGRVVRANIEPRHARLVVGACTTLCTYLLETLRTHPGS